MFMAALRMLRQKGYIDLDDKIAYLSGSFGEGGGTTFLEINKVSEVFDRSYRFPSSRRRFPFLRKIWIVFLLNKKIIRKIEQKVSG